MIVPCIDMEAAMPSVVDVASSGRCCCSLPCVLCLIRSLDRERGAIWPKPFSLVCGGITGKAEAGAEYFISQFSTSARMVLWVFGYGSLIWRPGFNYDERVIGYVKDYRRVFHQGSVDHRGTIEQPGRTVTLEYHKGAVTWGAAFRVSGHDEEKIVLSYLDVRERAYDLKAFLEFFTVDSSDTPTISGVLTYIATSLPANKSYLGPAPLEVMARQIATSHGPSGPNHEYLFRLEEGLYEIGVECVDEDLVELANEVRKVLASLNPTVNSKVVNGLNGQHLATQGHLEVHQIGSPRHRVMLKS